MPSLLCLDLGTSAAKAALIDTTGTLRAQASSAYPTRSAPGGGAEQAPSNWVRSARAAITAIRADGPGDGSPDAPIAALSLTGQMQDLVLETDDGTDVPAILYSDTRAAREADELHAAFRDEDAAVSSWDRITGNLQDATSCAAMFRRLVRTDPDLVQRTRGIVFGPAGHLAHLLGLGCWCDPTTAAATGLLDARSRTWSPPIAAAAGIDETLLPAITTSAGEVIGRTGASAEQLLGLPAGLPVVLAPGDAGATTLGLVGLDPGDEYAYLGSSGWLATVLPRAHSASRPGASHHLALGATRRAAGGTLRISALLAAGAAASWAREALLEGVSAATADAMLERREAEHGRGATGLLALPSLFGERFPVRDGDLRAALIGMGPSTRGIDMYAAVLEGIAHALAHAHVEGAEERRPLAVTGGGAASAPWLRILADVMGRPVRTLEQDGAALVGCAIAAADALGLEHGIVPLAARETVRTIEPDPSAAEAHASLRPAHRALYTAVAEVRALQ
ncbi:FGGY family carbohydrate kinase [Brachybacterium sp. GCM10030267]|uniref:FGGY family carbohydrate kinase n=1 Tax=Brachybacterium sp. GCM10030267 TaxID=3273381 RepID=UPI0036146317